MTADAAHELPAALRRALHNRWEFTVDGERLHVQHRDRATPYRPPHRTPDWPGLLDRLESAFTEYGVPRVPALPLRWRRETDLTSSAIQALDPYLKHRRPYVYRSGYLPQPVVRFTGKRTAAGRLADGFLTSFVNVSRVEPIKTVDDHAAVFDDWVGVLSRLGLHARHLELVGDLRVWQRGPVEGITLRYRHAGLELGDIVLLWNAEDPSYVVTDLGTGLERLRWAISRGHWPDLVHGPLARTVDHDVLDALRTAVLLIGSGIAPGSRGPGSAVRRLLRLIPRDLAVIGLSHAVRAAHRYWTLTVPGIPPWPHIAEQLDQQHERRERRGPPWRVSELLDVAPPGVSDRSRGRSGPSSAPARAV
jgi:hypothetical protein